uniref:Uncharacterized protein n=1 Tax=Oryza punctata TaxID=4537 RepID=A0A0E0LWD8_ORYPU
MPPLRTYSRRRRRGSSLSPIRSLAPAVRLRPPRRRQWIWVGPLYALLRNREYLPPTPLSPAKQADVVAHDTEVLPPSGSCLSSSPASHVWARHVKDWGCIFYIRVDLQGSYHTYPDVGGPFQSSQEADKAIDRYLEDHRDPKM